MSAPLSPKPEQAGAGLRPASPAALPRLSPHAPPPVEMWFDVICPWCLIGLVQLERAMQLAQDIRPIRLRPFRLHRDWPADGLDWTTFQAVRGLPDRVFAHVAEAGRREGLAFDFGAIVRVPDTGPLHRLILAAEARGEAMGLYRAFARAYFHERRNLADAAAVADLAREAGFPAEAIAPALMDDDLGEAIAASEREAGQLGASGVPFFRLGSDQVAYGAAGTPLFLSLLDGSRTAPLDR